ncbi:Galactokinase [Geobacillus sp. WSUCF1]|nr:Galactokinase [Geobacillus sp. WSUCF1]
MAVSFGLTETFKNVFGGGEERVRIFFAPGRVNLIGEHTDYNGGHVLPCALEIGTYALVRQTDEPFVRLYSQNFPETGVITVSYDDLSYRSEHGWANYPKGSWLRFKRYVRLRPDWTFCIMERSRTAQDCRHPRRLSS